MMPKTEKKAADFSANQSWRLVTPGFITDPFASIAQDEQLLQQVVGRMTGPTLSIVGHPQCLVVTRRETRMAGFTAARAHLAREGWPTVVRVSGGSCVPQCSGMLNLSLCFARPKDWSLEAGYQLICNLLKGLLREYDLKAEEGEVPGAFCDGRFNLQVGGRKLVGTAQRWAGSRQQTAVLVHACLLVDCDLFAVTRAANLLYHLCQQERQFDPKGCVTLRECLGTAAPAGLLEDVKARLSRLLLEQFKVAGGSVLSPEGSGMR